MEDYTRKSTLTLHVLTATCQISTGSYTTTSWKIELTMQRRSSAKKKEKKQRIEQPTNTGKSGLIQSAKIRMGHTMPWCGSHA
jgi:hypothetical protein